MCGCIGEICPPDTAADTKSGSIDIITESVLPQKEPEGANNHTIGQEQSMIFEMVEVGQWVLLGLLVGFAVQWALDTAALERIRKSTDHSPPDEELRRKIQVLESNLTAAQSTNAAQEQELADAKKRVQNLESQLQEAKSRPSPTAVVTPSVQDTPTTKTLGLEEIEGLTQDQIDQLALAGIQNPGDLATKNPDQILEALNAQPWDMIDPQPWIDQAKSLGSSAATATAPASTTPAPAADDFTQIEGLNAIQADLLNDAGILYFSQLAQKSADEILEAVNAQPWDMIDTDAWIESAKEKSNDA